MEEELNYLSKKIAEIECGYFTWEFADKEILESITNYITEKELE